MSAAPISAIPPAGSREDQVSIGQYPQEDSYSSALAQSMKRQENRDTASSVPEMIKDAKEKADAHAEQLRKLTKTTPRYGDAPLEAYARISRARTPAQAGSAAGYARRRLVQLESAARSDPEHADQIKAAITQTKKAVARANRKKLELNREQLSRARIKRMMKEKKRREEQRIRQELRRNQTLRAIRESGYIQETDIANRLACQLAATKMELRQQAEQLGLSSKSMDAALQGYSSAVETAQIVDAPVSSPQVDVEA